MNLIERYVNDVGRRLPSKERDEVKRELRSALLDDVDRSDREPSEEQMVEALHRLGPPAAVAASYWPAGQYLIGPELYSNFKRVLGLVMTILLSLLVAGFATTLLSGPVEGAGLGGRLLGLVWSLVKALPVVFSIVVLIFAGLQRLEVRPEREARAWDPRRLPALRDADLVGRGETAFNIMIAGTFLALLHIFRDALGNAVNPGWKLVLNDLLVRFLPWVSAVVLLGMALHAYLFWRGRWAGPTRIANLLIDLFGLAVLFRIALAVSAQKAALEAASLPAPVPTMIAQLAWTSFAVVAVIVAWETGKVVGRVVRGS